MDFNVISNYREVWDMREVLFITTFFLKTQHLLTDGTMKLSFKKQHLLTDGMMKLSLAMILNQKAVLHP